MAVITVVKTGLLIVSIVTMHYIMARSHQQAIPVSFTIDWFLIIALLAETITYFVIRRKNYRYRWAYIHVFCCLFALVVIPVTYAFLPVIFSRHFSTDSYIGILTTLSMIRLFLFGGLMIAGHIFFVLLLAKMEKPNSDTADEVSDTTEVR